MSQYLRQRGIKQKDFAERINTSQATVSRIATGASGVSLELAKAIQIESGGAVKATDLLGLEPVDD